MSLVYREFEIFYDDPGVTIHRSTKGYGTPVIYKKRFPTVEDGLAYIAERIALTENRDVKSFLESFKTLRSDLKTIASKITVKDQVQEITPRIPTKEEMARAYMSNVEADKAVLQPEKRIIKKIIKKVIKD